MTLQTLDDLERELKALMQNAKDKRLRCTELSYAAVEEADELTLEAIANEVTALETDLAQCVARIDEIISQLEQIDRNRPSGSPAGRCAPASQSRE